MLKGKASLYIYCSATFGLYVYLKGGLADIALRGDKGKPLKDNIFLASTISKLASNNVMRASNG